MMPKNDGAFMWFATVVSKLEQRGAIIDEVLRKLVAEHDSRGRGYVDVLRCC